jgi:hypothetical protein
VLQRIVYFSRNTMDASHGTLREAVDDILEKARVNNAAAGVTGALIFNSNGFAQVLEGEREDVAAIFERIQCDPRHSDVLVLEYETVESRRFPNWSMAYVGASRTDERLFGAVSEASGFDSALLRADEVLAAMERLVREEESPRSAA